MLSNRPDPIKSSYEILLRNPHVLLFTNIYIYGHTSPESLPVPIMRWRLLLSKVQGSSNSYSEQYTALVADASNLTTNDRCASRGYGTNDDWLEDPFISRFPEVESIYTDPTSVSSGSAPVQAVFTEQVSGHGWRTRTRELSRSSSIESVVGSTQMHQRSFSGGTRSNLSVRTIELLRSWRSSRQENPYEPILVILDSYRR